MNGFKYEVQQATAAYGTPQPEIKVTAAAKGLPHRALAAELHRIASLVEIESEGQGGWAVRIDINHDRIGQVCLELLDGDAEEVAAGLAVLATVVAGLKGKVR